MKLTSKLALLAALLAVVVSTPAITEAEITAVQTKVTSVPAPEMAATAADTVKSAKRKDRNEVAKAAIQSIAAKNRTSVLVAVSAIIKAEPSTAVTVARAATQAVPEQALEIARVAAIAAPSQKTAIRSSVASVATVAAHHVAVLAPKASVGTAAPTATGASKVRSAAHEQTPVVVVIRQDEINQNRTDEEGNQQDLENEAPPEDVSDNTVVTYGDRD